MIAGRVSSDERRLCIGCCRLNAKLRGGLRRFAVIPLCASGIILTKNPSHAPSTSVIDYGGSSLNAASRLLAIASGLTQLCIFKLDG